MQTNRPQHQPSYKVALVLAALFAAGPSWAQTAAPASAAKPAKEEEEVLQLSPFEVSADATTGYAAATTLAGNRLATELRDIGNAVTVITSQFLKDIGATDNKSLLQYTTNTEVGGIYGNFSGGGDSSHIDEAGKFTNPNQNTRIRGLTSADNTRDFFLTDIPWEGYNIDGVDLQRGPNSILFGQGSPAGIINTRTKSASFKDSNEVSVRVGSFGSNRETVDFNKVLIKNELALRVAAVRNDEKYRQDPAYSLDKRLYGAIRYEPGFLKKGDARTIIRANIEFGDIGSNNPRQLAPNDAITPWFLTGTTAGRDVGNNPVNFANLNKLTPNQIENEDDNTGVAGHGLDRPSHNGPGGVYLVNGTNLLIPKYSSQAAYSTGKFAGNPNEYYNPWFAGSLLGVFGSPAFQFTDTNATQGTAINWEPQGYHGMDTNGVIGARNNSMTPYLRAGSVQTYSGFAKNAKLYYNGLPAWAYGLYKDKSITDPSIFDFYNNLFDGPTKHEFQKFRAYNASIAQTFMHEQLGFEVTYNNERYKSGKWQLLGNDAIQIDINRAYNDAHPDAAGGAYSDGTPNPNVGTPYVGGSGVFGNNVQTNQREDARLTVFADHDFSKDGSGWVNRLLGRHVITGLLSTDKIKTDNRDYSLYSIHDPAWEFLNNPSPTDAAKAGFNGGSMVPYTFIYLGKSLKSASTASGAYIPNPDVMPQIHSGKALQYNAKWKPSTNPSDPTYVDPNGYWHNPYYPLVNPVAVDGLYRDSNGAVLTTGNLPGDGKQADNPTNYVGVQPYNINVVNSFDSKANQDANTHDARLTKSTVSSRAFDWQAHFWDNAIVGTFGVRKDIAKSWTYSINTNAGDPNNDQRLFLSPQVYHLKDLPDNSLEVTSHAWTTVAHLNQLGALKRLPVQVTLFYNHSTDFQPAAQRVDVYGVPLSAPSGVTKDFGILLETNDGRYSVKLNKYETTSTNASSAALGGAWFIGSSQAWAGNWVNRFEFNWTNDTIAGYDPTMAPTNTIANYEPAPGEDLATAQAREAKVIASWRAWQKSVDPRFYAAWGINLNDKTKSIGASVPAGFAVTEDSKSQGYELEFNASPIRNWRISLNASKTTAQRQNVGGTNLKAFMAAYTQALGTGAPGSVGDLRIWWGGAGNETVLQEWNGNINSEFNQRKLQEGTNVPELRQYRYNAITNYDFDTGILKGVNVGGGVRYESGVVIGYKPIPGALPGDISFDIAHPYMGASDTNFDLWVGYNRRMWHEINWSVQLNVRNVGVGKELVPITTEPDGSAATYRIRAPQTVMLTNTFRF